MPLTYAGSKRLWIAGAIALALATFVSGGFRIARLFISEQPKPSRGEENVFASYAGSASCKECHAEIYNQWILSNHGQAEHQLRPGDEKAFRPSRAFQHGSQHTEVRVSGTQLEVVVLGLSHTYERHSVARVIGNSPLRQFLVPRAGGWYQVLEASYDPLRDEWFNVYENEDRQPGEWGHWTGRGMSWNDMCANCHNTFVHKNYHAESDSYATTMAEVTVGCEACHGPMKSHVEWSKEHRGWHMADPGIRHLSSEQIFETCAQCHSRRAELTGDFAPGDSFLDHHSLRVVDETDLFYPDGQVRDEDYEYSAFLGSKMHTAGIRCIHCHDPHTAKVRLPGNLLCMSCHSGGYQNAPKITPAAHSFHKIDPLYAKADPAAIAQRDPAIVAANGGECVNCHMPQTFYMQRHRRHDHGFTIPDPLMTQRHGIPNACNRCHADKKSEWALEWTTQWYGPKMERPSRARTELFAAAKSDDPGAGDCLAPILSGSESAYWKASAAALLGLRVNSPAVVAALVGATNNPNPLVRANAAKSLEGAPDVPEVKSALKRLLEDPSRSVRFSAEWALRAELNPESTRGTELLRILDFMADQPAGQMQKGAYYFARNELRQALVHYRKAVEWEPYSAPIRHDLAVVLSQQGETQQAVEHLEVACRLEPQNAECHFTLALAYQEAGAPSKALEELRAALKLNPAHASAWYNYGLALNELGETGQSLEALARAAAAAPNDPRVPYARAAILARARRIKEAEDAANQALKIQSSFQPARELLDALKGKQGEREQYGP